MCWHKWTNWVEFTKQVTQVINGKQFDCIEHWQKRNCAKCGYIQSQEVRGSNVH